MNYTLKGSYDLFLSNLKYLLETVGADKIRVRVPKIPKLNTYKSVKILLPIKLY